MKSREADRLPLEGCSAEAARRLAERLSAFPLGAPFKALPAEKQQKRIAVAGRHLMIAHGLARHIVRPSAGVKSALLYYVVTGGGRESMKRRRGPKPQWSGPEGVLLVLEVDAERQYQEVKRSRVADWGRGYMTLRPASEAELRRQPKRSLTAAIRQVRDRNRALWGGYSPETLRVRYYDGLAAREQFCTEFRKKSVQK